MLRFYLVIFYLLIFPFSSWAVHLLWADFPDGRLYRIDLANKQLMMETSPNVWVKIGVVTTINMDERDFPPVVRVHSFELQHEKQSRLFLIDCTNQIYRFNFSTLILERFDNTYYRGYNCLATKFMRKDTLFSFGGYGFWQTNNIQTYYKRTSNEWESYSPKNNAPKAINNGLNGYLKANDTFFSAFNSFHSDAENQGKVIFDDGVYQFSFNSKAWEKQGTIRLDRLKELTTPEMKSPVLWTGQYFLIEYYESPFVKIHIADPVNNKLYLWTDTHKVFERREIDLEHDLFKLYCWHDTLYFYNRADNKNGVTPKHKMAVAQLQKESILIGDLYEKDLNWQFMSFITFGLIAFGTGIFYIAKSRKSIVQPMLNVGDSSPLAQFNPQERMILKALIENYEIGGIESQQINDLLGLAQKAPDNQRKIRNDIIKSLNSKINLTYGISEGIIRIPTTLDKRFYRYELEGKVFDELSKM